jgi:hypothetical protein
MSGNGTGVQGPEDFPTLSERAERQRYYIAQRTKRHEDAIAAIELGEVDYPQGVPTRVLFRYIYPREPMSVNGGKCNSGAYQILNRTLTELVNSGRVKKLSVPRLSGGRDRGLSENAVLLGDAERAELSPPPQEEVKEVGLPARPVISKSRRRRTHEENVKNLELVYGIIAKLQTKHGRHPSTREIYSLYTTPAARLNKARYRGVTVGASYGGLQIILELGVEMEWLIRTKVHDHRVTWGLAPGVHLDGDTWCKYDATPKEITPGPTTPSPVERTTIMEHTETAQEVGKKRANCHDAVQGAFQQMIRLGYKVSRGEGDKIRFVFMWDGKPPLKAESFDARETLFAHRALALQYLDHFGTFFPGDDPHPTTPFPEEEPELPTQDEVAQDVEHLSNLPAPRKLTWPERFANWMLSTRLYTRRRKQTVTIITTTDHEGQTTVSFKGSPEDVALVKKLG